MTASERVEYQLSVDTGGTFTDGWVSGGGRSAQVKVDTTPADLTEGFVACAAAAAEAMGSGLAEFLTRARLVHFSSTIATNIVVQRTGAPVGLVVTAGHESTLYGDAGSAVALLGFVAPGAVRGVAEETAPDGSVRRAIDPAGLEQAVRELLELGVHMVVVSLAGAHLNPTNEQAAKALIETSYPRHYLGALPLVLSSTLSLHPDDHARTALAVANAYLHPALATTLYRAESRLRDAKLQRPLLVVGTDGSSTRVAKTRAIDTYNSGPTAGVLGSAIVAAALGIGNVVTFDVGGTTTDVAYVRASRAPRSGRTAFGDLEVPHPSVALASFGLGGGSLITRGPGDDLTVGPRSAGAVPGPACFGLGGSNLTPTDVWLALGYLEPGSFLSGRRTLDPARARAAAAALRSADDDNDADEVDATLVEALHAVHASLAEQLHAWAAGEPALADADPADCALFSYGGGGGLLAVAAADALGFDQVVVFPQSSVFSAFGGGLLPIAHTYHAPVTDGSDAATVAHALTDAAARAGRDMRSEGVPPGAEVSAVVTLDDFGDHSSTATTSLAELVGGSAAAEVAGEVVLAGTRGAGRLTLRVQAPHATRLDVVGSPATDATAAHREVRDGVGVTKIPVRPGLGRPGAEPVVGPAFLAAADTTVLVPEGWTAEFDPHGYGIVRRNRSSGGSGG